jgi:hypothetical protein
MIRALQYCELGENDDLPGLRARCQPKGEVLPEMRAGLQDEHINWNPGWVSDSGADYHVSPSRLWVIRIARSPA